MATEILYLRGSAEILSDLLQALDARGFAVKQISSFEDVFDYVMRKPPQLLIIDATAGEAEAAQRAVELSTSEVLAPIPIVFISANSRLRVEGLHRRFKRMCSIDFPFRLEQAVAGIEKILGIEPEKEEKKKKKPEITPELVESVTTPERPLEAPAAGSMLSQGGSLETFEASWFLPQNGALRENAQLVLDRITSASKWTGLHARRVSMLASSLSESLAFGPERDDNVRTVSCVLTWGFLEDYKHEDPICDLRRVDIFHFPLPSVKESLAKGLDRTAELLENRFQDELGRRTVAVAAAYLRNHSPEEHQAVVEDAQCLLALEFIDRACWQGGFWDPWGAHRAMRSLRNDFPFPIGLRVQEAMTQLLGEAVVSHVTLRNAPYALRGDETRRKQALQEAEKLFGMQEHIQVPVDQLIPGMRLARPVETLDGEVVLRSNLELDPDLIFRLWQLAAVRPIKTPAIIAPSVESYLRTL